MSQVPPNLLRLPPVEGVTKVVLQGEYFGQLIQNSLHYRRVGSGGAPEPMAAASRVITWWDANIKANVSADYKLTQVLATDLSANSGPGSASQAGLPKPGTQGSAGLPGNVAMVASFRTNLRGRSYRGRFYMAGIGEIMATGNQILEAFAAPLRTGFTAALTLNGPTGEPAFELVVVSYFGDKSLRTVPVVTKVTQVVIDGNLDSQRRRLTGRGR